MAPFREIHTRVASVLVEALGVDEGDVIRSATVQGDLGAESIDLLDIVFRLEREFGIKIPQGELFPNSIYGDQADLVKEGRLTDRGLVELRLRMPYADLARFERDRRLGCVAELFTIELIVRHVEWKLGRDDRAVPVDRADTPVGRESPAVQQPVSPGRQPGTCRIPSERAMSTVASAQAQSSGAPRVETSAADHRDGRRHRPRPGRLIAPAQGVAAVAAGMYSAIRWGDDRRT
jgi:acyl carrier protein